jgi:nucleoid-associated protein YgaU
MIPQAHRCAALSLLLAAAATLVLYQPDAAPAPTPAPAPSAGPAAAPATPPTSPAAVAGVVPDLTPGTPWTEPEPRPARPVLIPTTRTLPAPAVAASRARPTPPRKAFATVEPGETLADVARRVYGTPDAADRLWQANRDALPRPDSPVEPGALLRTP